MVQASFETWSDGPFGKHGKEADKAISYYEKGPVVGLILDFAIRKATQNKKSLDDVMQLLYWQYYKKMQRGFTDAEFQQACETTAGISLAAVFEYVYTTKEIDYNDYLSFAGLQLNEEVNARGKKYSFHILTSANETQQKALADWLGE